MHRLLLIMPPSLGRSLVRAASLGQRAASPPSIQLVSIGEYLGAFFLYPVLRRYLRGNKRTLKPREVLLNSAAQGLQILH